MKNDYKPAPDMLPRMAELAVKPPTTAPTTIRPDVMFNSRFSFLKCRPFDKSRT